MKPTVSTSQKVVDLNPKKEIYEQIWSMQQAINTAVAEKRVVRFKTDKSNRELKKEITDLKNCSMRKPDKDSNEVAVIQIGRAHV